MKSPTDTAQESFFPETRWSVVLKTGDCDEDRAYAALSKLCEDYWYPLYAYVRKRGYDHAQAQDLTQEFFARILEKQQVQKARKEKGKFRSFLLVSMNHFLTNEWRRQNRQKRGGGKVSFFSELERADERFSFEVTDSNKTADLLFEEKWALAILQKAVQRLKEEWSQGERKTMYESLKPLLAGDPDSRSYREVAEQIGLTEGAVKVAVHRMRQRLRDLLHEEVAQTVEDATQIHEELKYFLKVFGGNSSLST